MFLLKLTEENMVKGYGTYKTKPKGNYVKYEAKLPDNFAKEYRVYKCENGSLTKVEEKVEEAKIDKEKNDKAMVEQAIDKLFNSHSEKLLSTKLTPFREKEYKLVKEAVTSNDLGFFAEEAMMFGKSARECLEDAELELAVYESAYNELLKRSRLLRLILNKVADKDSGVEVSDVIENVYKLQCLDPESITAVLAASGLPTGGTSPASRG